MARAEGLVTEVAREAGTVKISIRSRMLHLFVAIAVAAVVVVMALMLPVVPLGAMGARAVLTGGMAMDMARIFLRLYTIRKRVAVVPEVLTAAVAVVTRVGRIRQDMRAEAQRFMVPVAVVVGMVNTIKPQPQGAGLAIKVLFIFVYRFD